MITAVNVVVNIYYSFKKYIFFFRLNKNVENVLKITVETSWEF